MALVNAPANAVVEWHGVQSPPLSTPWTHLVGPDNALPEYPRPQMARTRWLNLNGVWDYTGRSGQAALAAPPPAKEYRERILVPYPTESALSGIQRHDDQMWYRKVFKLPGTWRGQRVLLHFGAVDQIATVWVNNQQVAHHEGGYTEFSADITRALRWPGAQEITVRVEDRNESNPFPVGKQRNNPGELFYTGASGIWQTVWMEPVRAAHIDKLDITPDLTSLTVTPRVSGTRNERAVVVVSQPGGRVVSISTGKAGQAIRLPILNGRLWTPDDPYLYDLKVGLVGPSGKVVDEVSSYAGLRTIGVVNDANGRPRIALNGKTTFPHGPLDQGFGPDGIYTAPTDEALRFDLEQIKALGMNFVRKHGKVEPARWYYWADKLGLMVWQDMPSLDESLDIPVGPAPDPVPEAKANFERELSAMIDQLRSVTSIVGWVVFNEGWGEYDTARIANAVKAQDPTRMANIQGIFIDHDMSPGTAAFTQNCAAWVREGLPATASVPAGMAGAAKKCTFVHGNLNQEALTFNTGTATVVGGVSRERWRIDTLQLLTHETEHPRFEAATAAAPLPAGVTSPTCTRANVLSELSEIAAGLSEFTPIYRAAAAEASPTGPRHTQLASWFQEVSVLGGENIQGALTKMGCSCNCPEVDAHVRATFA